MNLPVGPNAEENKDGFDVMAVRADADAALESLKSLIADYGVDLSKDLRANLALDEATLAHDWITNNLLKRYEVEKDPGKRRILESGARGRLSKLQRQLTDEVHAAVLGSVAYGADTARKKEIGHAEDYVRPIHDQMRQIDEQYATLEEPIADTRKEAYARLATLVKGFGIDKDQRGTELSPMAHDTAPEKSPDPGETARAWIKGRIAVLDAALGSRLVRTSSRAAAPVSVQSS